MTWWSKIQTMILSGCHVYIHSHCLNWYSNILYDAICSKWKTKIWSPTQNIHIVFLGWVQYLKVQWGLGGGLERLMCWDVFASATKECFALQRSARVRHVHRTLLRPPRWFSMPTWGENHTLLLFLLHQKCLNYSLWIFRTPFFFSIFLGVQSRFSLRLEDLMAMMRSGKSSTKSLGSTVSSAGTVEWWVDFNWQTEDYWSINGFMSSQLLYFELDLSSYSDYSLYYDYYHFMPVRMYTDSVHICLYCTHLFSVQYISIGLYPWHPKDHQFRAL